MATFPENILLGKHYIGLEFFSRDNQDSIAFVLLQKKKDELTISKKELFTNIESLLREKSKFPAVLAINNVQVLQKEIQGTDTNDRKLLHKAFPNLQADDFYYEIWRRGSTSVVAICRKSYVEGLIESLAPNFNIVNISLGITSLANLAGFGLPGELATNTQLLAPYDEESILNGIHDGSGADYDINGLTVPNTHLLPFSGALQIVMPGSTTGSTTPYNKHIFENFKQKAFFEKGIKFAIGLILGLLLINFFLFTYYFDKAGVIAETISINKSGIENTSKLKLRLRDKEEKLKSFTVNVSSRSSSILNEIIKPLPSSILLSEIVYHPLDKKIREGERIIAIDSLITISGNTVSNEAFTKWVETTEKMNQVKKVTISSFGKDHENNTAFTINIELKQ